MKQNMTSKKNFLVIRTGFTLLEVMVVLAIIAIMAVMVLPRVMGALNDAQKKAVKADLASLSGALNMYKLDNFAYPSSEQGLAAIGERGRWEC